MTQYASPRNGASLIGQIYWSRKVKAFFFAGGATFALLAVFWALSVRGFVAHSTVRLAITDPNISLEDVDAQVHQFWKTQTGDTGLSNNVQQVSSVVNVQNPSMIGHKLERLRNQLGYRIDRDPLNRYVDIRLALSGSKDIGDTTLVQNIADNIASGFASLASGSSSGSDLQALHDLQLEKLDRAGWLIAQIEQDIDGVHFALTGSDRSDAQDHLPGFVRTPDPEADLERKLNALMNELDAMQFSATPPTDPELVDLKLQIDSARRQLVSLRGSGELPDEPLVADDSSPFMTASHRNSTSSTVDTDEVGRTVDSIDINSLKSTIDEIRLSLKSNEGSDGLHSVSPFYVKGVQAAQLIPACGLPSPGNVLTLFLISGLVGTAIAWRFEPMKEDVGFSSVKEIGDKLKLPVISTLNRKSEEREFEPDMTPVSNLVLQLAKFFLLTIIVTVVVAMVVSPQIRAAFWESPFNGLARIVWFLTGK